MNIKPIVYDSLTPAQRVIAAIEAEARNDESELERLVTSCPYKHYKQRDAAFIDTLDALRCLSMAVELDITALAFRWAWLGEDDIYLERMAALQEGWLTVLESYGINREAVQQASPPRTKEVATLFKAIAEICKPDAELVKVYSDEMRQILEAKVKPLGGLG